MVEDNFCPVCKSESKLILELQDSFLKMEYQKYFSTLEPPENCSFINYKIHICENCSLVFSSPLIAGNEEFYSWISSFSNYYPKIRWEFEKIKKMLAINIINQSITLLDVGCGAGIFIEYLKSNSKILCTGIDTNKSSIEDALNRGLNVHCLNLEELPENSKFDVISSNHVLEHLPDPVDFIIKQKQYLKPSGKIFISTPLSPMSFEVDWFDPLNFPPHHLTRWNIKSYKKLAEICNCSIKIHLPYPSSTLKRAIISFSKKRNIKINKKIVLINILFHPIDFLNSIFKQSKRAKYNNIVLPDSILVEFTPID